MADLTLIQSPVPLANLAARPVRVRVALTPHLSERGILTAPYFRFDSDLIRAYYSGPAILRGRFYTVDFTRSINTSS
jgi:hypothetical protein